MQLLSSGLRAQLGRSLHKPPGLPPGGIAPPGGGRSIHMPGWIPRAQPPRSTSAVGAFVKQARAFLTRVAGELTAPGAFNINIAAHAPHGSAGPKYSANPYRLQTIQQRLNATTRVTLGRPLWSPYMPRAPVVPRNVTHVGLGTARNFSSARPLFQNVVDNVPVVGRAFWEADWDVKMMKEREAKIKKYSGGKENKKSRKLRLAPNTSPEVVSTSVEDTPATQEAELNHYFPTSAAADVTTVLLIPLAPTPTSRLPLPANPSVHTSNHPLIPFAYLASVHDDHVTHSLRVSSLFSRLDTARAFDDPHVTTSAYGHSSGLCTVLEVKFHGWTESRVRGILGEAGTGWCVLEEVHQNDNVEAIEETLSEMSFDTSPAEERDVHIDPSASFVLPTLDFSASWGRTITPDGPAPMNDLEFHNAWASYLDSVSESDSDLDADLVDSLSMDEGPTSWGDVFGTPPVSRSSSADGWTPISFSSSFSSRMQSPLATPATHADEEPREAMF